MAATECDAVNAIAAAVSACGMCTSGQTANCQAFPPGYCNLASGANAQSKLFWQRHTPLRLLDRLLPNTTGARRRQLEMQITTENIADSSLALNSAFPNAALSPITWSTVGRCVNAQSSKKRRFNRVDAHNLGMSGWGVHRAPYWLEMPVPMALDAYAPPLAFVFVVLLLLLAVLRGLWRAIAKKTHPPAINSTR